MSDKFQLELKKLKDYTLEMGEFSVGMFTDSLKALKDMDEVLAEEVHDRKKKLAYYSNKIDEETLRMLTLYQPVASDIRLISCISQMNTSLYRLGRNGKDIAQLTTSLPNTPHLKVFNSICHMAEYVTEMINDALESFKTEDPSKLLDLEKRDNYVDDLQEAIFRESFTYMMEDNRNISRCIEYVMISRYLERMGDHACLMGEKIYFMIEGKKLEFH
ncbi:MAG: phosphate signaling complex protein PhoU [Methanomicrobiaceae archaeon]|nr:phosphate signaling complex protein PhoU [Methanomicrobiaceae archaeon]